jgi:hypothetical protein
MDFTRSHEALAAYNRLYRASPQVDPTANDAAERVRTWRRNVDELARLVHEAFWLDSGGRYSRRYCHFELSIGQIQALIGD